MQERLIVSGGDEIREIGAEGRRAYLRDAGALLVGCGHVFAAGERGNTIWRINEKTFMPTGLFAGGPGVCRMLLSQDGAYLYTLCADADSILMLSARSGAPMLINRVGVNPCTMTMDETGRMIVVAGGASGEVLLLDWETLCVTARLQTCGVVFDALLHDKCVYALSLDESLNSVLTAFMPDGVQRTLSFPGMPGALAFLGGQIAAATHEGLFLVRTDSMQVLLCQSVPGRAGRLIRTADGMLMKDMWSDTLFLLGHDGQWRKIAEGIKDAAVIT